MRIPIGVIAAALLCVLSSGCNPVEMGQPFASTMKSEAKKAIEGVWQCNEMTYHVAHTTSGTARVALVGWDKDQFKLINGDLSMHGDEHEGFLSCRFDDKEMGKGMYFFGKYKYLDADLLLLWIPERNWFDKEVKEGRLKGTVSNDSLTISDPPAKMLEILSKPENSACLRMQDPLIFRRVAKRN